jgi:DnaJ-class molecular chaperone
MKWHPDRKQNSRAANERFFQAGEAYKMLFEKAPKENYGRAETSRSGENRTNSDQESARHEGHRTGRNGGHDEFADTVFRGAMLDYAIKLEALLRQFEDRWSQ